jgi:hypothetical protein
MFELAGHHGGNGSGYSIADNRIDVALDLLYGNSNFWHQKSR